MRDEKSKAKPDELQRKDEGQVIPVKIINHEEEPIRVTDKRFWVQDDKREEESVPYSFKPSYVEDLEKKLSDSQKKVEEVLSSYREFKQESTAEIKRARERLQNEFNRRAAKAQADLVGKFIDVLENFERALVVANEKHSFESLLEGVQLIRSQFVSALAEQGVTELNPKGERFNPELAEAVGVIEVEQEAQDQMVLEVVNKGYCIGDMLVRPAKVKVGRATISAAEEED